MNNKRIWLSSPHMGGNELKYINDAFQKNWIAPVGPHLDIFENKLSAISNDHYVAALSSGTSAIHLALILLGIKQNDEVICSSFTFSASANPIVYQGARPIFVDSEYDTWNMSPEYLDDAIRDRISKGRKPKAIILVHLYGMPAKMNEILMISNKYNIPIIEDAAEALGSSYHGLPLGTLTKCGVFSFNGNKIITTSSGGALVSSEKKMIEKAKFLATQARDNKPYYEHSNIGYNYRLSNISAAIGIGQLEKLEDRVARRREIFEIYKDQLSEIEEIGFIDEPENFYSNRWITTITISKGSHVQPEDIRQKLESSNIESRPLWKPMHLQPIFNECKIYGGDISKSLFNHGLCLPSGSNMSESDLDRVIKEIKKSFEK